MGNSKLETNVAGRSPASRGTITRRTRSAQTAEQTLVEAKAQLERELAALRAVCPHEHISETTFGSWEPHRICEDCGIEEAHGGSGFKVLVGDRVLVVNPSKFWALRKPGGLASVYWCYGNRFFAEHPALVPLEFGRMDGRPDGTPTRCCEMHDLDYAGRVIDSMPPKARDEVTTMSRADLDKHLVRYQAAHPEDGVTQPESTCMAA